MRVVIVGAGGHGAVVADILFAMSRAGSDIEPLGFVDDGRTLGSQAHGLPILGHVSHLPSIEHDGLIVAVGDNRTRQRLFESLGAAGERFASAVHPTAIRAHDVTIGIGSMVCAGVVINPGTVIGVNAIVNTASSLDHHNTVGAHVHVAPGVRTGGEVDIEEGALVGIGSVVIPRKRIGRWAIVGAGAVVVRDVAEGSVVVGVPAAPAKGANV